jgi:hypothetical protein
MKNGHGRLLSWTRLFLEAANRICLNHGRLMEEPSKRIKFSAHFRQLCLHADGLNVPFKPAVLLLDFGLPVFCSV